MANLEVKQKILGSIFPEKLVFEDENYRTTGMNPALALILHNSSDLQKQKSGESIFSENDHFLYQVGEIDYEFFKKQPQEGQKSSSVHESVN